MTDKELSRMMEQSAEEGRRALFDEYCGYVYAICANKLKGCGSPEDTDECLSDTFAAVFRYLESHKAADGVLSPDRHHCKAYCGKLFQAAFRKKGYYRIYGVGDPRGAFFQHQSR